jgi:hypothetical protein
MSDEKKIHLGNGVLKPGTRPIKVIVDESGEYWLCDANVDTDTANLEKDCTAHGSIQMAEGG